jgi:hypothetical protein
VASAAPARAADAFTFSAHRLTSAQRERMTGVSWHVGCPVGLGDLRDARIAYWDFGRRRRIGELIVNRDAVPAMRGAFSALYDGRFPLRRMRPVDAYGGDDPESIEADNTPRSPALLGDGRLSRSAAASPGVVNRDTPHRLPSSSS